MNSSLFLHPTETNAVCDLIPVQQVLASLSILGEPLSPNTAQQVFYAAEGFARHIIFAGCSPYLRFSPQDANDDAFCHVALHGPFAKPVIQTGQNTSKPRCPHCRGRLTDWQQRIESPAIPCAHCGQLLEAIELDWHQQAAVGRILIEMRNIFPGEATPGDQLMSTLNKATGFTWRYAWADRLI